MRFTMIPISSGVIPWSSMSWMKTRSPSQGGALWSWPRSEERRVCSGPTARTIFTCSRTEMGGAPLRVG
ncbi:MAG: hypothetical protein HYU38_06295 [Candidatus Tectomicrobia bacterium]|nr:hypothetical protein [Candidatus Tectomicrobia bacterium]